MEDSTQKGDSKEREDKKREEQELDHQKGEQMRMKEGQKSWDWSWMEDERKAAEDSKED